MRKAVDVLDPLMPAQAAARQVAEHHLAALPVVSKDGRLLGAVTADAALVELSPAGAAAGQPRVFT
jgi:Mg/Co/Ni transporter MgtE